LAVVQVGKSVKRPTERRRAAPREALVPDDESVAAGLRSLPRFDPYPTSDILSEARALMSATTTLDDAVSIAWGRLQTRQLEVLIRALGLDPGAPNVHRVALTRLAGIHHGLGRLVHRWVPPPKLRDKSSLLEQAKRMWLVDEVRSLARNDSISEREAVKRMAKARGVPESTLRQRYERAKRRLAASARALEGVQVRVSDGVVGLLSMSNFERLLWGLQHGRKRHGDKSDDD
jgi:hypothetical protein